MSLESELGQAYRVTVLPEQVEEAGEGGGGILAASSSRLLFFSRGSSGILCFFGGWIILNLNKPMKTF